MITLFDSKLSVWVFVAEIGRYSGCRSAIAAGDLSIARSGPAIEWV
jgi:hypothetical protein